MLECGYNNFLGGKRFKFPTTPSSGICVWNCFGRKPIFCNYLYANKTQRVSERSRESVARYNGKFQIKKIFFLLVLRTARMNFLLNLTFYNNYDNHKLASHSSTQLDSKRVCLSFFLPRDNRWYLLFIFRWYFYPKLRSAEKTSWECDRVININILSTRSRDISRISTTVSTSSMKLLETNLRVDVSQGETKAKFENNFSFNYIRKINKLAMGYLNCWTQ